MKFILTQASLRWHWGQTLNSILKPPADLRPVQFKVVHWLHFKTKTDQNLSASATCDDCESGDGIRGQIFWSCPKRRASGVTFWSNTHNRQLIPDSLSPSCPLTLPSALHPALLLAVVEAKRAFLTECESVSSPCFKKISQFTVSCLNLEEIQQPLTNRQVSQALRMRYWTLGRRHVSLWANCMRLCCVLLCFDSPGFQLSRLWTLSHFWPSIQLWTFQCLHGLTCTCALFLWAGGLFYFSLLCHACAFGFVLLCCEKWKCTPVFNTLMIPNHHDNQ